MVILVCKSLELCFECFRCNVIFVTGSGTEVEQTGYT